MEIGLQRIIYAWFVKKRRPELRVMMMIAVMVRMMMMDVQKVMIMKSF